VKRKIMNELLLWKDKKSDMPFMLIGARQVGKTYIIKEFCKKNYDKFLYVNLEYEEDIKEIFDKTLVPEEIIDTIGLLKNISIDPETTAIFFDEIQVSERAVTSLKYFSESSINYNILSAGSLLGVALNRFSSSFPVGKVYRNYMYPLDFQEFLWGIGEERLDEEIQKSYQSVKALMEPVHKKCLDLYRDYIFVGGMPASVLEYIEKDKLLSQYDTMVKKRILDDYIADMSKYTTSAEHQKIIKVFKSLPKQLGRENRFKYSTIDKRGSKRKFETSIDWLINSKIAYQCNLVENPKIPLKAYEKENIFKLYVNDTGLLMSLSDMTAADLIGKESNLYKGMLTENYVAQTFASNKIQLYFWKSKNNAEIDFLISYKGSVVPVEVKSATNTKSKSLKYYREKYSPKLSMKVSANNFNESSGVKSIPLYAAYLIK